MSVPSQIIHFTPMNAHQLLKFLSWQYIIISTVLSSEWLFSREKCHGSRLLLTIAFLIVKVRIICKNIFNCGKDDWEVSFCITRGNVLQETTYFSNDPAETTLAWSLNENFTPRERNGHQDKYVTSDDQTMIFYIGKNCFEMCGLVRLFMRWDGIRLINRA